MRSKRPKNYRSSSKIPNETIELIERIRRENPTYGKAKISVIIRIDHKVCLSESSVGRVLKKLILQGRISRSISARKVKKRRVNKKHAKAWIYGNNKPTRPKEMVQIDQMPLSKNNISVKDFGAWYPVSKYVEAELYKSAQAGALRNF